MVAYKNIYPLQASIRTIIELLVAFKFEDGYHDSFSFNVVSYPLI